MLKKPLFSVGIISVVICSALLLFQNCSDVSFSPTTTDLTVKTQLNVSIDPSHIDFGMQPLNTTVTIKATVKNNGDEAIHIDAQSLSQNYFEIVVPASCSTLDASKTCDVEVKFKPLVAGLQNWSLNLMVSSQGTTPGQPGDTDTLSLSLSGNGFFLPPSTADKAALVGWYSYKMPNKVQMSNSQPGFQDCSPVVPDHGHLGQYCYEPSGAHGMTLSNNAANFSLLTDFILGQSQTQFSWVTRLDDLFGGQTQASDNEPFVEALYYYGLAYLVVPTSADVNSPSWNPFHFSIENVDDGLSIIANGNIAGHIKLRQSALFSIHKGSDNTQANLKNGINTLVAIWLDVARVERKIKNAKILTGSNSNNFQEAVPLKPNVVRGYVYDKLNGAALANATIELVNNQNIVVKTVSVDAQGFYQIEDIPNGTYQIKITSGTKSHSEQITVSHLQAPTAVLEITRGL